MAKYLKQQSLSKTKTAMYIHTAILKLENYWKEELNVPNMQMSYYMANRFFMSSDWFSSGRPGFLYNANLTDGPLDLLPLSKHMLWS